MRKGRLDGLEGDEVEGTSPGWRLDQEVWRLDREAGRGSDVRHGRRVVCGVIADELHALRHQRIKQPVRDGFVPEPPPHRVSTEIKITPTNTTTRFRSCVILSDRRERRISR